MIWLSLLFLIVPFSTSLSSMIIVSPNNQFQTGIVCAICSPSDALGTSSTVYSFPYVYVMSTPSLNASIGILSSKFQASGNQFGWRLKVGTISATQMSI
jgi:hypothetical protein